MADQASSLDLLLHPEMLSKQGLSEKLVQSGVKQQQLLGQDRENLVEMYYKTAMPLPQRKYKLNRRGKLATKSQISIAKKRTHTEMELGAINMINAPDRKSSSTSSNHDSTSSQLLSSYSIAPSSDRIKPPPSTINFDRKMIKLGGKKSEEITTKPTPCKVSVSKDSTKDDSNIKINSIKINSVSASDASTLPGNRCRLAPTSSSLKITKIMPQKSTVPPQKFKLSRTSRESIPRPASSPEENNGISGDGSQLTEALRPTEKTSHRNGGDDIDKQILTNQSDDEGVTKKFKRIDIQWP